MALREFPVRRVRRLIKELAETADETNDVEFEFEISGAFDVDQQGELSLMAVADSDLPAEIPADLGVQAAWRRIRAAEGAGVWSLKVWRHLESGE